MSEQEAPNPLALELKNVLSRALEQWSNARYKKEDGTVEMPVADIDAFMNGILNFTGITMALVHRNILHMVNESPVTFNYQMAHKYAEHFMTIFLDNMEIKDDE